MTALAASLPAAQPVAPSSATNSVVPAPGPVVRGTNAEPGFVIHAYQVRDTALLSTNSQVSTNSLASMLAKYTGTNVTLADLVSAAAVLQREYRRGGYAKVGVAIAREQITNGIVTMNVFRGGYSQVRISGVRYPSPADELAPGLQTAANTTTNVEPRFPVRAYEIRGDTLLSTATLMSIFTNYVGTNISVADIVKASSKLQMEYRNRGFPTVNVTIPPQSITNGIVKIRVFQGRLSDIEVVNNRFFSSNNIMRALPSLHTNVILNGTVLQAELDRANANQDRTLYAQLMPGPEENTTTLRLKVDDRLPLHAKIDFNNQNSPGTPDLRLNSSAVYNNLWQWDHSIGVQYGFSPELYKSGTNWAFYDLPLVANYSAFYRLPLGNPAPIEGVIQSQPGTFGYDEATRQFRLPPPSGRPELLFFASRSTIDTGLMTLTNKLIQNIPGVLSIREQDVQQDITLTGDLGTRLSIPLRTLGNLQSGFSGGLDYKTYELTSSKTNLFYFSIITVNPDGTTNPPVNSTVASPVPTTRSELDYLPLSFRYDASLPDSLGRTAFGVGLSANTWHSGPAWNSGSPTNHLSNTNSVKPPAIIPSLESSGYWVILTPSLTRDLVVYTNWILTIRVDGQWASEPLISNEQYGIGGVNSVRGYHEGQVFGDTGWHTSLEQKTPPYVVGRAYGKNPLTVRGSVYMDYADAYLLDPQKRQASTALWGTGLGFAVSAGPHFEARFLFSWPLLTVPGIPAGSPRFDFGLTAQF